MRRKQRQPTIDEIFTDAKQAADATLVQQVISSASSHPQPISILEAAKERDPTHQKLYDAQLGELHFRAGNLGEAREHYESSLAAPPIQNEHIYPPLIHNDLA